MGVLEVAGIALLVVWIYTFWYIASIPRRIIKVQKTEANYTQEELKSFRNVGITYIVMVVCGGMLMKLAGIGLIILLLASAILAYNISLALGREGGGTIGFFIAPFLGMYYAHKNAKTGKHGLFLALAIFQLMFMALGIFSDSAVAMPG